MSGTRRGMGFLPWVLMVASAPVVANTANPIDLSALCDNPRGDCVVAANTTIVSASGPLAVGNNFTVNPGVVLEFRVPIQIDVAGNMVLSGIVGAPGDGGAGGAGGDAGQPGEPGTSAPSVVGGTFNVRGSITLNDGAAAVAEGGTGGSGGLPGDGSSQGGAGGAGGAAGSLTFNGCSFRSASGASIRVNGGAGGIGASGAIGGAGGAGGTITINARQNILTNALISALGGAGGSGGSGAGANGANGTITLTAQGQITAGQGTLTPAATINASQSTIDGLDPQTCVTPNAATIPTLSEWALILLASLMAMFSIHRLRRKFGSRSNSSTGI